ncbi:hypothetical protein BHM03_00040757 [Ensete ventricosum]|nr:hypothetical protein BHM03_00040757 [Ensete ventricosum]
MYALDMWAMGAIMAELFTLRPLFPGSRFVVPVHTGVPRFGRYGSIAVDFDRYRPLTTVIEWYWSIFARYVTVDSDSYIPCNSWYRPVQGGPRTGLAGRDSQRTPSVAEKLGHLSLSSNTGSDMCGKLKPQLGGRQPPPAMKAGAWHGHSAFSGRPHDIPSARGYYTRKVAG